VNRWRVYFQNTRQGMVQFDSVTPVLAPFNGVIGPILASDGHWYTFSVAAVSVIIVEPVQVAPGTRPEGTE